ncbi:MAG: aldo/keto reductase, partial [Planctomycetota bacterium]
RDLYIQCQTDAVEALQDLKEAGKARAIGLSGKTTGGHRAAFDWADVLMVEYHAEDESHAGVIATAASRGVGVLVKKGLAAGRLAAGPALEFVLANDGVGSCVVGGLDLRNVVANVVTAGRVGRVAA